ncbi:SRPBCC family protein [Saccharibacillus alkalitolerans]|uniref:SRPBCC family protein n=1 Tax=Saccharibacillus alkalitolerans TaxID=2705290 RepID=A0ABX0F3W1_9BACL|nr:SRPBCC family protein [Saccharibacillus alkalitolerans]NGZ75668.1 SRPBCC family protein [Saccharibacillus alkalitolerans]
MVVVKEEVVVHAPIALCFDAARDVGLHPRTVWPSTKERTMPGGRRDGLMEKGETVVFEAVHFGVRQRLSSIVEELEAPRFFVDRMTRGAFARMMHRHEFEETAAGTIVRDILDFASPLGPLGRLFDAFVLKRYMRAFILYRQSELKKRAEEMYADHGQLSSKFGESP